VTHACCLIAQERVLHASLAILDQVTDQHSGTSFALSLAALTIATSPGHDMSSWGTASKAIIPFTSTTFDSRGILLAAFIANLPQVFLSLVYFSIKRHPQERPASHSTTRLTKRHTLLTTATALGCSIDCNVRHITLATVPVTVHGAPRSARS
jgi:hypothetical protein